MHFEFMIPAVRHLHNYGELLNLCYLSDSEWEEEFIQLLRLHGILIMILWAI